ncbi:MAG TPA: hypothetical protein VMT27_08055 [Actinomycetes bacterium]|nr:hypothetical protein [Actinomycetes bacterium]
MTELDEVWRDGADDGRLVRREVALERRIRDRSRNLEGENRADARVDGRVGCARRGLRTGREFIELEGSIHAVSVASGRVRLHALGEIGRLREVSARVPFVLRRLAMSRARTAGSTPLPQCCKVQRRRSTICSCARWLPSSGTDHWFSYRLARSSRSRGRSYPGAWGAP